MKDFFHKLSWAIVKKAREQRIDTIVIGKNLDWKQGTNIGKRNNQAFLMKMPFRPTNRGMEPNTSSVEHELVEDCTVPKTALL